MRRAFLGLVCCWHALLWTAYTTYLTTQSLSFKLPPKAGTRDTLKQRTQVAMNMQFFNPVTTPPTTGGISVDTNTELIGFGATQPEAVTANFVSTSRRWILIP